MTPREPLPLPAQPQTPLSRLSRRVARAVEERGEAAVVGVATRLLAGSSTPEDVTSGAAQAILGDDDALTPAAAGALALTRAWHRRALPALVAALDAPEPEVRSAVHLVLAARADALRADAAVDHALVDRVGAGCCDPDPEVRASAASALGALAGPNDLEAAVPVLSALVMDVDADIAAAAELALDHLAERLDRPELRASTDF